MDTPENTAEKMGEKPGETAAAVPDVKMKQKRKILLVSIGVAIVIILAAACAYVYFTPQVATKGDTVSVYFTEAFENGTVYASNMNTTEPLVFTLGNSSIITGFEEAVTGMSVNEIKKVTIPFTYNPGLIYTVNRTGPIANTTFIEGQTYIVHDRATNTNSTIRILNVTPKTVTWDANNPLAGQNLTFTIKLANITKP
ncbi:FKBP-type peptidyl-prolyl cis-trans isomerase [Methanoregula sp.]|uniref:FKBP-type peptidyl-prolyl cis-trans isomerase n=1 Tax=Methanoregula sp. TaxID=2052170 RepID=UPI003BAF8BCA